MSTGTVVYVAGAKGLAGKVDVLASITKAGLDPEWTEVVGLSPSHGNPQKAALALIRKGAGCINLVRAFLVDDGTIDIRPDVNRIA